MRDLYGVVTAERANKGILMTTGRFTSSAVTFSENKPLELIDGDSMLFLLSREGYQMRKSAANFNYDEFVSIYAPTDVFWDNPNLGPKILFINAINEYKTGNEDIQTIGNIVPILQNFNFCTANTERNSIIQKVKRETGIEVCRMMESLLEHKFLRGIAHIISAQNYFVSNNIEKAIWCYEKTISFPETIPYDESLMGIGFPYIEGLKPLTQIVHNLCVLYLISGNREKADNLQHKFRYAYELEKQRHDQFVQNHPDLAFHANREFEMLFDFPKIESLYINDTLISGVLTGVSMLSAIVSDADRNGYIEPPSLGRYLRLDLQGKELLASAEYDGELFIVNL